MNKHRCPAMPTTEELNEELKRARKWESNWRALKNAVYAMVFVAALSVLAATGLFPVLRIYGNSMADTLSNGDVVVAVSWGKAAPNDVIAFYSNNKVLVKRVIAEAGDWIEIDETGTVFVNGVKQNEPYLKQAAYGDTELEFPYQVPDGRVFVMGDNREISIDSRNSAVGCIRQQEIIGKLVYRIWPFENIGIIH